MAFDLEWLYDIFFLEAWHLFSIIIATAFFCYIYLQARRTALFYHYLVLQGIILAWLICKVFKTLAPDAGLKWFFIVAQYLPVCFLGSAFLMFGYVFSRGKPLPRRTSILLNIPPAFFFFVVATNNSHHLFYSTYDFTGDTFGQLFYAYSAMTYAYLLAGIFFCAVCFRKLPVNKSIQARILTLGIVVPLLINVLYVCGLIEPRFDFTPVSCNLSLALFAYAVYKYRFLDIVPLGIASIFNNLQEGVAVVGRNGQIVDHNEGLGKMLGMGEKNYRFSSIEEIDRSIARAGGGRLIREMADEMRKTGVQLLKQSFFLPGANDKYLHIHLMPLNKPEHRSRKYVCVFYDNTAYKKLIEQLENKNSELALLNNRLREQVENLRRLAIIGERNRIAREIHDILGHSLILILNILESSAILLHIDPAQARKKARQALFYARQGLEELKSIMMAEKGIADAKTAKELEAELAQLADRYSSAGMKVDLTVRGTGRSLGSTLFHAVFRLCQEALTNSLRHGLAEQAAVFVRIHVAEVEVFILDNGRGCNNVKKGHGLAGMETRIKNLKGRLFFGSSEEGGFIIHARLPC